VGGADPVDILLSAYACSPGAGSEPGAGWNWARELALAGNNVTVLTLPDAEQRITEALSAAPVPGLTFVFVPVPRRAAHVPGQRGVYVNYLAWQWAAYRKARELVTRGSFDLVHHVTFGSLSLGTFMGLLPIPFVFGPVGGGQTAPRSLRRFFATRWRAEVARTLVVRGLLPVVPTARLGAGRADLVLAANHETARLLRRLGARSVHPMPDMGVSQDEIAAEPARPSEDGQFRLLWVGRFQGHKGLPLALRAVAALPADSPVRLRIVGYGPLEEQLAGWIEDLELGDRVDLVGRVPYTEMRGEYRAADALLFTSIRESGGIQMLEALAQGCPVIALDHQGPRVLISDDVGVRTPVGDGSSTIAGLAAGVQQLVEHPEQRRRMSHNGIALAREHTWAGKARTVTSLYGEVLGRS
jgi:glycosyltransferase involved in cell wall biosynthesis